MLYRCSTATSCDFNKLPHALSSTATENTPRFTGQKKTFNPWWPSCLNQGHRVSWSWPYFTAISATANLNNFGENILPGFTLNLSLIDDCISQVHYYFLFLCYNFHYLQINLSIDHRKDWKHQVKMIQLIVDLFNVN